MGMLLGGDRLFPSVNASAIARRNARAQTSIEKEKRRALIAFHSRKRQAKQLQRTPSWANHDAIRTFYDEAARLTSDTGISHHVDHRYPLQGKLVSGLHVENNLQILIGVENSRKRNSFEIE